jgi:HSP20 family protein
MSLISRNLDFFDDMDKVVDTALGRFFNIHDTLPNNSGLAQIGYQNFSVDVIENKDNYEVVADVPGFNSDDIAIEHKEGYLTITAERNFEDSKEDVDRKFFRKERRYNKFYRSFIMPENVDADKIEASLDKGVLHLTLPKLPKLPTKSPKRIAIKN